MSYDTRPDLAVESGQILRDGSLKTAVTISLLTWGRANPEDGIPDDQDLRGWWGDTYPDVPGDQWGSRLWTLRGKPIALGVQLAPGIAKDALKWMLEDNLVSSTSAIAEQISKNNIGIRIEFARDRKLVKFPDPWVIAV